ncbi:hypothetical protein K488DRAFT_45031, partial [Vararia minispora EC-137]
GSCVDSASSTSITITFPTASVSSSASLTSSASANATTTFTVSVDSQFSFLTQTSLLLATPTSSSISITQTNPDAPATIVSEVSSAPVATVSASPILPSTVPSRVYPPSPIPSSENLSGYTLVAVLFDSQLDWQFVTSSSDSETQLFSWMPPLLQASLGLAADQTKTFALQVYIPDTYQGPQDVTQLLTTFMVYIPDSAVSDLASQLKTRSSAFYTALGNPYQSLAVHVNPSFPITAVSASVIPGGGTTTATTSSASSSSSRTNAIIGVVSALGGLTLIILAVLVYRSVKKRRELAHRRLTEEQDTVAAYPDRTGRDFDQDSVGGQRRRSFYFAEDSLRGAAPVAQGRTEYSYLDHPDGEVREMRRGGPISAPVLQQSSMNW